MSLALVFAIACQPETEDNQNPGNSEDGTEQGDETEQQGDQSAMAAVDLGLSVKWAECNLGAASKEQAGDYFAWGETEPKEGFTMGNYAFFDSDNKITKYNATDGWGVVDNKKALDLEDDAACAILKGSWRIPTHDDWKELKDNCTWTWGEQNGVNGYTVTSSTGASIFLPGASYKDGASVHDNNSNQGWYWTANLSNGYPSSAKCLYIDHNFVDLTSSDLGRYLGLSIRAVCN